MTTICHTLQGLSLVLLVILFILCQCVFYSFFISLIMQSLINTSLIVSENDQEIPQSQTAGKTMATRGRAPQQSRDTMKTNLDKQPALSSPSR